MRPHILLYFVFAAPQISLQLALEKHTAFASSSVSSSSPDGPEARMGWQKYNPRMECPPGQQLDPSMNGNCIPQSTDPSMDCPSGQKPDPFMQGHCIPGNKDPHMNCPPGQKPDPSMQGGCISGNNDPDTNCPPGQKRSPAGDSCNKKNPCPPGQKFEPAANGCVPEKQNPDDQKKKEEEKKKQEERKQKKDKLYAYPFHIYACDKLLIHTIRIKDTVPRKKDAYNKKLRDEKKKKEDEQKKQLTEKARGKKRFEFQRNRKRTRMGKCLLLVPLSVYGSIEGVSSEEYLTDFFSEEFVSSEAIDELWPADVLDPLEVDIDTDDYMKSYIEIAAQEEDDRDTRWITKEPIGVKREEMTANVPEKFRRTPLPMTTTTDLTVGVHQHDKRNPLLFIARIIGQFASRLGQIGVQVAGRFVNVAQRVGIRLANLNARGGARLAKNGGTKGGNAMSKGGRAVSNSKNWRNCLNGAKPVK